MSSAQECLIPITDNRDARFSCECVVDFVLNGTKHTRTIARSQIVVACGTEHIKGVYEQRNCPPGLVRASFSHFSSEQQDCVFLAVMSELRIRGGWVSGG